jgi:hypothetical protein
MPHFQRLPWIGPGTEPKCPYTGLPLTQSFELVMGGTPEPITPPLPVKAMNQLSNHERERARIARLGNLVPAKSLPRTK